MHDAHGRDSRDQVRRDARRDVLGLSERRLSDEDLGSAKLEGVLTFVRSNIHGRGLTTWQKAAV
jgi:hypothetical protein